MNSGDQPIEETVVINALPEDVFQALTDAETLQHWFPTRAKTDPRPGGEFQYAWDFVDPTHDGTQTGQYVDIVPMQLVCYHWAAGPAPSKDTLVTFAIKPDGEQTTVSLAHTGFGPGAEGKKLNELHGGAWSFYMVNLKTYLESGADNRAAVLGQKTL